MNEILNHENLKSAYENVVRNKGLNGVDGIGTDEMKKWLNNHWMQIKDDLINGTDQPKAVLGVVIPKRNSGGRLLGIPTTSDRMIQQAINQVLNPLFAPEFSQFNYGFRSEKSAGQAIGQA